MHADAMDLPAPGAARFQANKTPVSFALPGMHTAALDRSRKSKMGVLLARR
jgi:hypothetical protein